MTDADTPDAGGSPAEIPVDPGDGLPVELTVAVDASIAQNLTEFRVPGYDRARVEVTAAKADTTLTITTRHGDVELDIAKGETVVLPVGTTDAVSGVGITVRATKPVDVHPSIP